MLLACPRCDHRGQLIAIEKSPSGVAGALEVTIHWTDATGSVKWRDLPTLEEVLAAEYGCGYCGMNGEELAKHIASVRAALSP
jgi:hypothetical protein